ncbi:MAG: hypothetical protein NC899_05140 [Candidatus Omnitrophica bacterium]|nr:hypothetical protein [Candidatus Omnitrophota bacterium]
MKFVVFYSIFGTSIIVLWIGGQSHENKRLTYSWVIFSSGIIGIAFLNLIEVSEIIKIISLPFKISLELGVTIFSSFLFTLGVFGITKENIYQINFLKSRYTEIREIILRLGEKLERREVPKKYYKRLVPHLKKELEEIEKKIGTASL